MNSQIFRRALHAACGMVFISVTAVAAATPTQPLSSQHAPPSVARLEAQPSGGTLASTLTSKEAQVMSANAITVLRHFSDARQAIEHHNLQFAKDELIQAQGLLDVIRSDLPTLRIKDRIQATRKNLIMKDSALVLPDLVPIYSELDSAQRFMPTENVRAHLDKAKEYLRAGNKRAASNELSALDSAIVFTEKDLPLKETQANVRSAMRLLDSKRPKPADYALKLAEVHLPLDFMALAEPVPQRSGNQAGKVGASENRFGISSPDSPGQNQVFPSEVPSQTYG